MRRNQTSSPSNEERGNNSENMKPQVNDFTRDFTLIFTSGLFKSLVEIWVTKPSVEDLTKLAIMVVRTTKQTSTIKNEMGTNISGFQPKVQRFK
jgi:hypothetical protein